MFSLLQRNKNRNTRGLRCKSLRAKTELHFGVVERTITRTYIEMTRFLISVVAALVPERYRARWEWGFVAPSAAITCGALQLFACLGLVLYRYVLFSNQRLFASPTNVGLKAAETGGETAVMGMGMFVLAEYLIQPLTLLLLYFVIEGGIRVAAALATSEIVPTLPLQLIAMAHSRALLAKRERELGPPVVDLVQPGSGDFALVIASCRPKTWTKMNTISYDDHLYELVREVSAQPPRRWVYVLRKRPESKVVRGAIYQYSPDEVMPKAAVADQAEK